MIASVKNKKYVLEPPEGGWGYLIVIAVIIIFFSITSVITVFGLLFNDFLQDMQMSSTTITLLSGVIAVCYAISGFLTGPVLKIMTKRKTALLAAIIFNIGLFGNVFTYSTAVFFICQGILHGIGIGLLYNIACTLVNDYFVKRRLFVTSFIQTIIAFIAMCSPKIVQWSLDEYGYRGTLLLVAGVMLNNLVAVALLQPVEWHMKKIEITNDKENEVQLLLQKHKQNNDEGNTIPVVKPTDVEGQIKPLAISKKSEQSNAVIKIVEMFLDVTLFKEVILSFVLLGPALSVFADTTFHLMLPQALFVDGWEKDSVAYGLSLCGFGDLAGRIFLVIASKWISKIGSQLTYVIGLSLGVCSRLGMLWSNSVTTTFVFLAAIGFARCSVTTLIPVVVADAVSPEKFTSAMGICMLLCGAMNLILGPAVGAVRDFTDSYSTAFYILTSIFGAVILLWSIEICYKRNKRDAPKGYLQGSEKKQNT